MWTSHRLGRKRPSKEKFVDLSSLVLRPSKRKEGWLQRSCADGLLSKNEGLYECFLGREIPVQVSDNIEKDLDRTLPPMKGEQKESLRRVLRAFASFIHEIGYVQGLNYLAATLLHNVNNEVYAFWILVQLFKRYSFVEYYRRGMPGLNAFFQVLQEGIAQHAPALSLHFSNETIMTNMFSMKWALTLFGCKANTENSAAVMDIFLTLGWDFLIFFSIAILIQSQEDLCSLPSEDILVYIESIPGKIKLDKVLRLTSALMHNNHKMKQQLAFSQSLSSLLSSPSSSPQATATSIASSSEPGGGSDVAEIRAPPRPGPISTSDSASSPLTLSPTPLKAIDSPIPSSSSSAGESSVTALTASQLGEDLSLASLAESSLASAPVPINSPGISNSAPEMSSSPTLLSHEPSSPLALPVVPILRRTSSVGPLSSVTSS